MIIVYCFATPHGDTRPAEFFTETYTSSGILMASQMFRLTRANSHHILRSFLNNLREMTNEFVTDSPYSPIRQLLDDSFTAGHLSDQEHTQLLLHYDSLLFRRKSVQELLVDYVCIPSESSQYMFELPSIMECLNSLRISPPPHIVPSLKCSFIYQIYRQATQLNLL